MKITVKIIITVGIRIIIGKNRTVTCWSSVVEKHDRQTWLGP
jgi:hypothetical protein